MKGYDVCISACAGAGIQTVFTLMSEDIMEMVTALETDWSDQVSVIDARHEQNAVAMADAYARATDGIGACIVGRGPGLAQTGTALTTASKGDSRLLVLTAESARDSQTEEKNFDQRGYLEATVGEVVSIRAPEKLPERMTAVLRRLRDGEGPIAVQIPNDVLNGTVPGMSAGWQPEEQRLALPQQPDARVHHEPGRIDDVVDRYLDSDATKPPVIIAGAGARHADAGEALERVAGRMNAILTTTLRARGLFEGHPYNAGLVGTLGTNVANELLSESDFVLAVGCSLNDRTTDSGRLFADGATVVHVDTERVALGRHRTVDLSVVGDGRTVAERLDETLAEAGIDFDGKFWTDRMRRRIADGTGVETHHETRAGLVHPGELVAAIDDLVPENRVLATDGGHFTMWVLDAVGTDGPDDFVWLYDFLAIGLGLPAGVGAAQAAREHTDAKRCVAFCGDAGFMMSLQEIDTAVRHDLPLTVVVMNDEALGSEYHKLQKRGRDAGSAVVETPAIAEVARAMGADGHTIRSVDDLEAARESLLDPGAKPAVLDCRTDRDVRHRYYE